MKNVSIRAKILVTLVLLNVLGAVAVAVYLHQSYSQGLDVAAQDSVNLGRGAWEQLKGADRQYDLTKDGQAIVKTLTSMKEVTGADYGLLVDKAATDAKTYAAVRESLGMPDNWDEQDGYAMLSTTDPGVGERMKFSVPAENVPEIGKIVGVENGACTKTCHDNVKGEGAYWTVAWSNDARSRTHAVFPVFDTKGAPMGVIYAIEDISDQADSAEGSLLRTLLVIGVTLLAATLIMGALVDTLMFKRLNKMVEGIQELSVRVAGGDFNARFVPEDRDDEIGKFEKFFANVIDVMTTALKSLSDKQKAG